MKESILVILCFVMAIGIRLFFMMSGEMSVTDDFGYYQSSMVREQEQEPVMTSGIAFAYTESLSNLLMFTGNRPNAVVGYHLILQGAAFFFLFFGSCLLFGKAAAFWEILLISFAPWMISGIFTVSPENYYLAGWSFLFLMIGIYAKKTRERGWHRNSKDEMALTLLGFMLGVLCIWHSLGFLLVLFILYVMVICFSSMMERRKEWKKTCAMENLLSEAEETEKESSEVMPVSSHVMILATGIFLGGFCTLMKYTGITGLFLKEQFIWWRTTLLCLENGRCQDLSIWFMVWLAVSAFGGVCLQLAFNAINHRREKKKELKNREPEQKNEAVEKMEEKKSEKKKVNYIDNPLPLPKKHVKRTLDFKLDREKDDFDIQIDLDDDFDIS